MFKLYNDYILNKCVQHISAVAVLLYKNIKYKTLVSVLTAIVSLFILSHLLFLYLLSANGVYFEYTSDDKEHNIVVEERAFLLAGGGKIYEKTSFCTMKKVGEYTTDDGFRPFSQNAFFFIWNENDFELHHAIFWKSNEDYRIVKMKYAK